MKFCDWASQRSGLKVTLPTEAQWEWAARAGSDRQFFYGTTDTDFSPWANLADAERRRTYVKFDGGSKLHVRRDYPADYLYPLRDDRFTDKWFIVDYVGQYRENPFGLQDMVGNVCEWTRSDYKPYPYNEDDGRNGGDVTVKKVARGGSWNDRPKTAGSSIRFPFESYQKVYNVGFRVIIEDSEVARQMARPIITRTEEPLPEPETPPSPAIATPAKPTPVDGKWIDVLPLINPKKHTLGGEWSKADDSKLLAKQGKRVFVASPLPPLSGNYEVEVEFLFEGDDNEFMLGLPIGDTHGLLCVDGFLPNLISGLNFIDGKTAPTNETGTKGQRIQDGTNLLKLSVTLEAADTCCMVTGTLNGKPLVDWSGKTDQLAILSKAHSKILYRPGLLSVGKNGNEMTLIALRVRADDD